MAIMLPLESAQQCKTPSVFVPNTLSQVCLNNALTMPYLMCFCQQIAQWLGDIFFSLITPFESDVWSCLF